MRIGIGQIVPSFIPVNYPGYGPIPGYTAPLPPASSPASITLITGKVVSDPTSQAPTGYDCLAYQCGADPNNIAARAWCSQWGQVGAFPCSDPQCAPVASLLDCSTSVVSPVPAPPVQPTPVALTPQNIVQPLPDITAVTDALPAPTPTCSLWCDLNAAIAASPLIAVGLLAGAAVLLWPKKGEAVTIHIPKQYLLWGGFAVAAGLAYWYLKSSGQWDSWFNAAGHVVPASATPQPSASGTSGFTIPVAEPLQKQAVN